ncbi:MAG: peptidoglycan DD-metalloendopeptidase family protein [Candidatus Endonucleobacter bathymodioli]|uniref:Peptidoglycan DD-metalloendopeptidase family protein n=1 Tax=Candidatus Endonucleibacter bathymodioli TaxID=539814 RepID=A0AA90NQ19_9GAMM|nr:peptidoglycan DD-metalloendopeptidase family protein [Candidatus Endonucleobacter bathymodioli]
MSGKLSLHYLNVWFRILHSIPFFLIVTGCSHDPSGVQVRELRFPFSVAEEGHIVKEGDSLYSIAWRYNRDFKELAVLNNLYPPYTIYPGQRIGVSSRFTSRSLKRLDVGRQSKQKGAVQKVRTVKENTTKYSSENVFPALVSGWKWPVLGTVVAGFSLRGRVNKGIDISGELGAPVSAAEAGQVVYAGSGLSGYGKLIILKHNGRYLSAYAYNRELYVREGDSVKVSQKIAEIGSMGATEPKLHFEIRRDGKPVDPLRYLPKR